MKAFCMKTEKRIQPFGDRVCEIRILDRPLADIQREALEEAGVNLVAEVPKDEPYILFSDRTWFTSELIVKMLKGEYGSLCLLNQEFVQSTEALQELESPGLYEIAFLPSNSLPGFKRLPFAKTEIDPVSVDPGRLVRAARHPALQGEERKKFWLGTEMVFQIDHWIHILRVNHLSMSYSMEKGLRLFRSASLFARSLKILNLLMRSRSVNKWKIIQQLNDIEKGADIHPTAVVEFSTIKKGAKIGPFAMVRGCYVGEDAVIEQYAVLQMSVVGNNAFLPAGVMFNLCVAYPGAMISSGGGYQVSVFGYDSFMAFGATILDLSFGKTIRVSDNDKAGLVDSKTNFLGAAIGHRARVGNGARIGYGVDLPNDAFLVASSESLLRDWNDAPLSEAAFVFRGRARPVSKGGNL